MLAMACMRQQHFAPTKRAVQWPDAIGLGLFTASGTHITLAAGMPGIVAVLMGMVRVQRRAMHISAWRVVSCSSVSSHHCSARPREAAGDLRQA